MLQQAKKQGKALDKGQMVTKTVMSLSMKTKTKKLTNAKKRKSGLNSSKGVQKKPKNI